MATPAEIFNVKTSQAPSKVTLNIEKRTYGDRCNALNFTQEQIARFELRYDDGEVMLIKGNEIVYSEILEGS